jgi:hypothetical protein
MKRLLALLILLCLANATNAIDWEKQQRTRQDMEKRLFQNFCSGAGEGSKCRVPSPWSEKFWGVCCNGQCNGYTEYCDKPGFGGPSLMDVIVNMPCMDKKQGEECDIPRVVKDKYPDFHGVCCNNQCLYLEEQCGEVIYDKGYNEKDEGPPSQEELEEMLEFFTYVTCIGIEDGKSCQMSDDPNSPLKELNLFGVCCSGKCHWRSSECPGINDTKPDLVIIGMEMYPENVTTNIPIDNLTITIRNQGGVKTTDPFWIEIIKGDESAPITQGIDEDLNAGETVSVSIGGSLAYQNPDEYILKVIIDSHPSSVKNNLIDESDEENNEETWTIFVAESPVGGKPTVDDEKDEIGKVEEQKEGYPFPAFIPIILIIFIVLIAILLYSQKSKRPVIDYELRVKRLLSEKKTIEEMIELAKIKYHKRTLDEESFREIIRDNQKRLIEIETRIKDMEARMGRLEKKT